MTTRILLVPAELVDPVDQLSANTLARCKHALLLWREGGFDKMLITGGVFLPPHRQTRAAAHSMHDWFMQEGVEHDSMLIEPDSLDTFQNISCGLTVLRDCGVTDAEITVATQFQHALRFAITFFLAHGVRVKISPVRQPAMGWKEWVMEWLVLIPYHLLVWHGSWFIAAGSRKQRAELTWDP